MLDATTKRRIDTARDILVGKVPDPKSQVEQITIALIYKFMDDMDIQSEELGGKRKFFSGEFARYGWAKLMRSGLGGHEVLNLYAEAITRMPENPGIPPLFRSIFKNAYLPYRDPETLKMFLKVIDEFTYEHSEKLGDAFEYLLSVMSSQGGAGQFRTPRHIIDFIVEIVDPKKNETVLDPACGTAGFLISSYKHILRANTDAKGRLTLTPEEKGRLALGFSGYDISPDMVRLSLVNMYLHDFADPHIYEYDTLTSLERWNEHADVILANPPFMSPKGGIRPHNRFTVQSKRSEVLFVDYMAEHLSPQGRAGIIVPEGIIFQSGTAYKQLRKLLVEEYLIAVVSLPAGVFNPYSGVKTSILILDKSLAKKASTIAFFKVDNDGFGLGAQRRPIDKNDLPKVQAEVGKYLGLLQAGKTADGFESSLGLIVPKEKIAANGDFNLSGERYRENRTRTARYQLCPLGELLEIQYGYPFKSDQFNEDRGFPIIRIRDIKPNRTETKYGGEYDPSYVVHDGDLLIGMDGEFNSVIWRGGNALLNQRICRLQSFRNCIKEYIARLIPKKLKEIEDGTYAVTVKHISAKQIAAIEIPLPPLEVQREIVVEIEGYQKVIDGARTVVENYRPQIPIDPEWPMVELGDICEFRSGLWKGEREPYKLVKILRNTNFTKNGFLDLSNVAEHPVEIKQLESRLLQYGDILLEKSGGGPTQPVGRVALFNLREGEYSFSNFTSRVRVVSQDANPLYVWLCLNLLYQTGATERLQKQTSGIRNLDNTAYQHLCIPLPPLKTQSAIVIEIEAEQSMVGANRELIAHFEKKIQAVLSRVWGR